jgi:serine protease Do
MNFHDRRLSGSTMAPRSLVTSVIGPAGVTGVFGVFPLLAALALGGLGCTRPTHTDHAPAQNGPMVATEASSQVAAPPPPVGTYVAPLVAPVVVPGVQDVAGLAERLKPTVVNIATTGTMRVGEGSPFGGMLPFGHPVERKTRSQGTGFIVDPAGYIVTNVHVIQGAEDIRVRLADDREFAAKVVGKDPKMDLALIKLEGASGLSAAVLGDSDALRVGDSVLAIGNPFGLGHTVTLGITSAKDRSIGAGPYDAFIQTDASINPGNSGGALFNLRGEVVGIPTMIRAGAQGIGFAVPVNALRDILPQLRDKGVVSRGKLGVHIQPLTADLAKGLGLERPRGALIAAVEPGGSGARAGILSGDVITAVDGQEVPHSDDLPRLVARHTPGSKIKLTVMRAGAKREVDATLDSLMTEVDEEDQGPPNRPTPPGAAPASSGKMGVTFDNGSTSGGAKVRSVAPDSPAAGQLAPGDTIVELDRQPIRSTEDLAKKIESMAPGRVVLLKVKRGADAVRFVALTLGGALPGARP